MLVLIVPESGFGALGIVIYSPYGNDGKGAFLFSFLIVPGWLIALLVPKKQHIGQLEILAAICVYLSVPQLVAGELIIHMVDNTSAVFSLVHGYSSKEDSAALVNIFHLVCAVIRPEALWDYIESNAKWPTCRRGSSSSTSSPSARPSSPSCSRRRGCGPRRSRRG